MNMPGRMRDFIMVRISARDISVRDLVQDERKLSRTSFSLLVRKLRTPSAARWTKAQPQQCLSVRNRYLILSDRPDSTWACSQSGHRSGAVESRAHYQRSKTAASARRWSGLCPGAGKEPLGIAPVDLVEHGGRQVQPVERCG